MRSSFSIYLILAILAVCSPSMAQPPQRISYVDTEYILDQLPDWRSAQKQLDDAADRWKAELQRRATELVKLKNDYNAELVLLPEETRKKREDEITQKQKEYDLYKAEKFGADGELFKKRQQLLKPIQDKVFQAIQDVAKENAQDFIFDKAGAVTMLWSNPKYDRSDEVVERIKAQQKLLEKEEAKKQLLQSTGPNGQGILNQNQNQRPGQNNGNPGGFQQQPGGNQNMPPPGQQNPSGGQQPMPPGGQPPQPPH